MNNGITNLKIWMWLEKKDRELVTEIIYYYKQSQIDTL